MSLKDKYSTSILALLLLGVGIFAYWPALNGFFLSDDFVHVEYLQKFDQDIYILLKNFWSNWLDIPTTAFYRPLISVTLYLDHLIWGWRPLGYHLTNLLLHFFNGILIFLLAQKIGHDKKESPQLLFPFLGAMLFLVWPLHPEAVYWIIGRVDVQFTLFYLLSVYLFVVYVTGLRGYVWLLGSLASFVAALASKEPAVTLPAVLAAYGIFFLTSGQAPILKRVMKVLHITAPFWFVLAAYFLFRWHVLGTLGGGYVGNKIDYFSADYWQRWKTLRYILEPINHAWPSSAYRKAVMAFSFFLGWSLLAFTILRVSGRQSPNKLLFGLLVVALSLLPLAPVFYVGSDLQSSRYLYLPSAFLWITVTNVLCVPRNRMPKFSRQVGLGALIMLLALSVYQLRLNQQPWIQASKEIQLLRASVATIAADRDLDPSVGRLVVLAGIPDNLSGAQVLRNGYRGFLGSVFHAHPINDVIPLTDDDRTGVMPIHAKNLAASASGRLYGVYRYIPSEGFKRVSVDQTLLTRKIAHNPCEVLFNAPTDRRTVKDMVDDGGSWLVTGPDPSVTYPISGCNTGDIDALRFSLAFNPVEGTGEKRDTIQVFWPRADTAFSEEHSMTRRVLADGAVHEYTVPLKSSPKWDIDLQLGAIRIDFPERPGGRVTFGQASFLFSSNREVFPRYFGSGLELFDASRISGARFDPTRSVFVLEVNGRDEFLLLPRDSWDPIHSDFLSITMRVLSKVKPAGRGKFYWVTDNSPEFSEDKSVDFPVKSDGQWHTYDIPLKHLPAWWTNGTGRQLRLNPYYGHGIVEIRAVSIGQTLPLPQITFFESEPGNKSHNIKNENAIIFRRVIRRQSDAVELSYQATSDHPNSILEVSRQPFANPNIPSKADDLEFKLDLHGAKGVVQLFPSQFQGKGMRYLRMVSIDSSGQPTGFSSDPIALLVED